MRRLLLAALFALSLPGIAFAQSASLSGRITDSESGDPLPTANVIVLEQNISAASDVDGMYEVEGLNAGSATIRISFVGYRTQEQSFTLSSGGNTLNVELVPDYLGLDEVVVTGIASATSKQRAEVSVARVDAGQLQEQNSYQDLSQLLTGKLTGVSVQPASGNVAGGIRFMMRANTGLNGSGQPVIYIDGVRVDNSQVTGTGTAVGGQGISMLANINPDDIESIDVLKGPAGAALYGTSGSNGVVLITTKRGRLSGGGVVPFNVTYKGTGGVNQQFKEYTPNMAGTPETANSFFRNGQIQQHTISASGGSSFVRYFASYDNRYEEGAIRNNQQDRQSFRANFEAFPMDKVTIKAGAGYTLNEINRPQNDNNILGYLGNSLLAGSPFVFTDSTAIESLTNLSKVSRFLGSTEVEYQPIPNLRLRASVGLDATEMRIDATLPSNLSYSGTTNGERNIYNRRNEQYTYDVNAAYDYNITPSITANSVIGFQAFNLIRRTSNITKQNFSSELITNVGAGADFLAGNETFLHAREMGIFGQQEFGIQNTFFVTVGLRRDFASTVGTGAPAIWYPKASFAVLLDQLVDLPRMIDFMKVRAAYGETGQLPGTLDSSPLRWQAEPSGYGAGAVTSFIGNADIEPERIREIELGIETSLMNRIGLEVTGYFQKAENSIIDFQNVPSTGLIVTDVPFNVGSSEGKGVEVALTLTPYRTRRSAVDLGIMYSWQTNEVKDLGGAQPIFDGFDINVIKEGMARDAFYTWSSRASFNDDGSYAGPELTTTDADGDGEPDRMFIGLPYPEHNGSFSLNVRLFDNLTINALADWVLGLSVYNNTSLFQKIFGANRLRNIGQVQLGNATAEDYDFTAEEIAADNIKELEVGSADYRAAAEVVAGTEHVLNGLSLDGNYIEDADYMKLREVSIRYDLSDLIAGGKYVRSLALSLNARNLWMLTNYSGADPEVNFAGARSASRAQDFLTLPQPRTIYTTLTIGI